MRFDLNIEYEVRLAEPGRLVRKLIREKTQPRRRISIGSMNCIGSTEITEQGKILSRLAGLANGRLALWGVNERLFCF
jgi:hypothetical protein